MSQLSMVLSYFSARGLTAAVVPLLFPLAVTLPAGLPTGQVALASTIGILPAAFAGLMGSWILSRRNRLRYAAITACVSTSLFGCLVVGSVYYGWLFGILLVLAFGFLGLVSLWGTWALARDKWWGALIASLPLCLIAAIGTRYSMTGGAAERLVSLIGWACLAAAIAVCAMTFLAPRDECGRH
ncbi:hypothetical protein [Streptomyces orinoci]|uniref:MFS transporter n=1 Tax=Streptomyces orinoci TaxID=67339 RepID=A0ABV3JZC2_STRON|nr:hypothetical protein [Streptomyces orinoci]